MRKLISFLLCTVMMAALLVPTAFAANVDDKSPPLTTSASTDYTKDKSPPLTTSGSTDYTKEKSPPLTTNASAANVDDNAPPVSPGVISANVDDKAPRVVSTANTAANSAKIPPAGLEEKVLKWRAYNRDTIGWLNIPDTKINNPVMWYPDDKNEYYLRRNEKKEEDFTGSYFADYRCDYGNYTLPRVTTIYGHSESDDPNSIRFGQLRKFLDDGFAKSHPYIYFSDGNRTYTFRVFAVYTTTVDVPYNVPNLDAESRQKVINEAVELSVRDYGYTPDTNATILTLSSVTRSLADGTPLYFPNLSRFVVMAYAVKNPNAPVNIQ